MVSLGRWSATPQQRTEELLDLDHLDRLYLNLIQRMGLILYLMKINIHKIYTADIAVPRRSVIELHGRLIGHCRKLCSTWQSLRNVCPHMLAAYRNVEIIQYMKCLEYRFP